MKQNLLRAEMVKAGYTQTELSKKLGMDVSTFYRKMKTGKFGLDEADRMIALLKIKNPCEIFFDS